MHHPLFVTEKVVAHAVAVLLKGLPDTRDVAVPEYSEDSGKEALLYTVSLHVLFGQESYQSLGRRQTLGFHAASLPTSRSAPLNRYRGVPNRLFDPG